MADGSVVAADAKILIDDNALVRQKEFASWSEPEEANPLEFEAKAEGLTYVKLDGDVGILGNGAEGAEQIGDQPEASSASKAGCGSILTRSGRHFARPRPSCTASIPRWSWPATAPTTS